MKKFLFAVLFLSSPLWATSTTRLGLNKIDDGTTPWGKGVRDNYDLIDSSVAIQTKQNSFSAFNTFTSSVAISSATFYQVRISTPGYTGLSTDKFVVAGTARYNGLLYICDSNFQGCGTLQNPLGLGLSSFLIQAVDGIGFQTNNPFVDVIDVTFGSSVSGRFGNFAVMGSSNDATVTYSGFTSTKSIDTSTIWSLMPKDGSANQPIVTDGSTHLSFSSTLAISTLTATGYIQLPSNTLAQLKSMAPSAVGQIRYCSNCATDAEVISTGTATGAWSRVSARTTTIQ